MFAHQVIESLNKQIEDMKNTPTPDSNYIYTEMLTRVPSVIKSAFKFHIESYKKTSKTFEHLENSRIFLDHAEFLKMPYKNIWLDYIMDEESPLYEGDIRVPKRGILVNELEKTRLIINIFNYHIEKHCWTMSPVGYLVGVGEYLKEFTGGGNIKPVPLVEITGDDINKFIYDDHADMQTLRNFLLLINCKNIKGVAVKAPQRLNKSRIRKGKVPIFTYKVLNVIIPKRASTSTSTSTSGGESTGGTVRLHFCRGHFKMFTKEKPLFGRHHGLYWWQPHVRGDRKSGVVMKDYNLKTT